MKLTTDRIVANKVREYWKLHYPQTMVAYFRQRYDWEDETQGEWCQTIIECNSDTDYDTVIFQDDFNEGQTIIGNLTILPLEEVLTNYCITHNLERRTL